jgi:hypothetical protein
MCEFSVDHFVTLNVSVDKRLWRDGIDPSADRVPARRILRAEPIRAWLGRFRSEKAAASVAGVCCGT